MAADIANFVDDRHDFQKTGFLRWATAEVLVQRVDKCPLIGKDCVKKPAQRCHALGVVKHVFTRGVPLPLKEVVQIVHVAFSIPMAFQS